MIGKLAIVCLALVASAWVWNGLWVRPVASPQPQPQPVKQDIYIVYTQMDVAEAMALQCNQIGSTSSYVCPLTGAGGGHAFKD